MRNKCSYVWTGCRLHHEMLDVLILKYLACGPEMSGSLLKTHIAIELAVISTKLVGLLHHLHDLMCCVISN